MPSSSSEEEEVWVDAPSSLAELHAMQKREKQDRVISIWNKITCVYKAIEELKGAKATGEAEDAARAAKLAKAEEERTALLREFMGLSAFVVKKPDFSGMSEAERAEEADRLRGEKMAEARDADGCRAKERDARIIDFDAKQGGVYYNRLSFVADPDEESPLGPMRFTNQVYETGMASVCRGVNVLSVKVTSSDVGFPLQVYGTVVARDSLDLKCVYLFRRDRDHCQLITSKNDSLILTGPKRGLALIDDNYVETDLKIKDHEGQDRELSKGIITIGAIRDRSLEDYAIETKPMPTRLSTVSVIYAAVKYAVEATVAIQVLQGEFCGTITAHTAILRNRFVIYDSKFVGNQTHAGDDGHGVLQLMRPVMCVYMKDKLIIDVEDDSDESVHIEFTPRFSKGRKVERTLGATKLRIKVAWSLLDP